jgi:hypothetical protein
MSPVQQQSMEQRAQDNDSPQMQIDSDEQLASPSMTFQSPSVQYDFNSNPASLPSSSSSSPFHPTAQGSTSNYICGTCGTERSPGDTMCWKCTAPLDPVPIPQTTSSPSTLTPNLTLNLQEQLLQFQLQRMQQLTLPQQQLQTQWQQPQPSLNQPQQGPSVAYLQQVAMIQRQRQLLQQRQNQARFQPWSNQGYNSGVGTSSNPINLGDSPLVQTPPIHFPLPNLPQLTPPVLNGGWPTGYQNPFASQPARDPAHYLQSYDYPVPNPSAEEIKDLLANIRPDEDIKVEDKDAIIPGMASHMRLMKHQQVVSYCMV